MKPGNKVICVNDKYQYGNSPNVKEGNIYIIRGLSPITTGVYVEGIYLEMIRPGIEWAFLRSRFRVIDESFSEKVLENILKEIKGELLVEIV